MHRILYIDSSVILRRCPSTFLKLPFPVAVKYKNLLQYLPDDSTLGYASADLKLLSVEYALFNYLPFNFCGDWVQSGTYNVNACPNDGTYSFGVPYTLPWDDGDITTWFATGWQGYSNLKIWSNSTGSEQDELLTSCVLHWKTYVTPMNEEDGWKTLPSAAQATIILGIMAVLMFFCCAYLSFCRRRRRNRHVTDADYAKPDEEGGETPTTDFTIFESEKDRLERARKEKEENVHKININMKEPDWY